MAKPDHWPITLICSSGNSVTFDDFALSNLDIANDTFEVSFRVRMFDEGNEVDVEALSGVPPGRRFVFGSFDGATRLITHVSIIFPEQE